MYAEGNTCTVTSPHEEYNTLIEFITSELLGFDNDIPVDEDDDIDDPIKSGIQYLYYLDAHYFLSVNSFQLIIKYNPTANLRLALPGINDLESPPPKHS